MASPLRGQSAGDSIPIAPTSGVAGLRLHLSSDKDTSFFSNEFDWTSRQYPDSLTLKADLHRLLNLLHSHGYLRATVDTMRYVAGGNDLPEMRVYLEAGPQYEWVQLRNGNIDPSVASRAGLREHFFTNKPVRFDRVREVQQELVTFAENNGYPFAEVWLDSVRFDGPTISAGMYWDKNNRIVIDSIRLEGDKPVSKYYLYNYTGVRPGDSYNEERIQAVGRRLQELDFLQEVKPASVLFRNESAVLNLHLEKREASRLNAILGVLPDNEVQGQIAVTGEVHLMLVNPFHRGTLLDFNFRGLQNGTQNLDFNFMYPYLFNTPLGVDGYFELFKQDTSFMNVAGELRLQYMFTGRNHVNVFIRDKRSSLLHVDTQRVKQTRSLPENIDVRTTTYGAGIYLEKLDYRLNPTRGYVVRLTGGVGNRQIIPHAAIEAMDDSEFNYGGLYDSLELQSVQYELEYELAGYLPLGRRHVLKAAATGGGLWAAQLFQNDMFRLGGIHLLRGFDELAIFASLYNVFTLEYRYLLDRNAYLYIFGDGGYYENQFRRDNGLPGWHDKPFGFGAGITFSTQAGIFTFNYALGGEFGQLRPLRTAKVHFGYINYF